MISPYKPPLGNHSINLFPAISAPSLSQNSAMDHGHGGMPHGDMCQMSVGPPRFHPPSGPIYSNLLTNPQMVLTFSHHNLCIITSLWRITSLLSFVVSLLAIVCITAGYEFLREISRRYETKCSEIEDGSYRSGVATTAAPGKSHSDVSFYANPRRGSSHVHS